MNYLLGLSTSERMALIDILGEALRSPLGTQQFIDASAGPNAPPVTVAFLLHTLMHLEPRKPETPEEKLAALTEWQRNAIRTLFRSGEVTAEFVAENERLRSTADSAVRVLKQVVSLANLNHETKRVLIEVGNALSAKAPRPVVPKKSSS